MIQTQVGPAAGTQTHRDACAACVGRLASCWASTGLRLTAHRCSLLLAVVGLSVSGCSGFIAKPTSQYNMLRRHVAATGGAYCDLYYCGSDGQYHYFNQSTFLGLGPTINAVPRGDIRMQEEMPFTKEWRQWKTVYTGVALYIWNSSESTNPPALIQMGPLPAPGP